MSDPVQGQAKKKGRSPSYPAVSLPAAIERAKTLWEHERQHPTPVETIVQHWGYRSFNGPASLALAALKKFGLVEDEGTGTDRIAKVSDLAVEIIANPDAAARLEAIRDAALRPSIHRELWDKYGVVLPSDANLKWELTRQRGFTETGATEFIPEYRETIAFAQLDASASLPTQDDEPEREDEDDGAEVPRSSSARRRRRMSESVTYAVPVAVGADVTVEGRFPLTEAEWNQFMAVLTAMKPGLVAERHASDDEDPYSG